MLMLVDNSCLFGHSLVMSAASFGGSFADSDVEDLPGETVETLL
jgi:hypothetical protein